MKTDQIDQILNSRLHDMEPAGGAPSWDQFQSRRKSNTIVRNLWRASAAVAASAAVVLLLLNPVTKQLAEPLIQATQTPKPQTQPREQEAKEYITPNIRVHHTATAYQSPTIKTIETIEVIPVNVQPIIAQAHTEDTVAQPSTVAQPHKNEPRSTYNPNWRNINAEKAKPRRLIAMSTFANLPGSSSKGQRPMSATQFVQSDANPGVLSVRMGRYQNSVDFRDSQVSHKFPISAGVTLSIPITSKFAIESGLTYTYLESTTETTQDFEYKYQQNVHYLGVPVSVAYKILEIKAIDIYTAIGATAEVAMAANVKTDIYSNGKFTSSDSKRISADGVQMSFNAAVGLNVHLTPKVGLYLEPNISHYLHNAKQPFTSRSKSDIQFNVRAGIKIQL